MLISGYQGQSMFTGGSHHEGPYKTFTISATSLYIKGHDNLEEAKKFAAKYLGYYVPSTSCFSGQVEKILTILIFHHGRMIAGYEAPKPAPKQPDISQQNTTKI